MDKHANSGISQTLLRIFYALTSPDYDIKKGIKKVYLINYLSEIINSKLNQNCFKSYEYIQKMMNGLNKSIWT